MTESIKFGLITQLLRNARFIYWNIVANGWSNVKQSLKYLIFETIPHIRQELNH